LIIGFNLPYDLSRIAIHAANARGRFFGGFSLAYSSYIDKQRMEELDPHVARIAIKHINSKSALKAFTATHNPDTVDLIPEGSETGEPEKGYIFRGHFLDLRTLAFSLTDKSYTLEGACKAFGVINGKRKVSVHGQITEEYIDYNRQDVRATSELAFKLLEEYDKHPIDLQPTKAYSPASIGKAHWRAMGIPSILERQRDFPKKYLGYAQSAFYGGRTSAHIRKHPLPVRYVDFRSTYPTVNSLLGLWRFVTAKDIRVVDNCADEIYQFLSSICADRLFAPDTWKHLTGFVKVIPNGDILPTRGKYCPESKDWQLGLNYLYAHRAQPEKHALWMSLPDVVASVLLNRRIPKIVDAFRIEAHGTLPGLKPIRLRGKIEIDPVNQDFFKVVVEERNRIPKDDPLNKFLKVLANAASYGIYAEMNRQEREKAVRYQCYGIDPEPFLWRDEHPEKRGEYFFFSNGVLNHRSGAARLMLALLEHCVTELGGTYVMEDTDSMAIVSSEDGGLVPCPGAPLTTADGEPAINAVPWKQVDGIADRFIPLKPYDPNAVPGSILKVEDVNFDPETKKPRQVWCYAISAKRYALFLKDEKGEPVLLKNGVNSKENGWKEHGLGHLLNPANLEDEDRDWIGQVWLNMTRKAMDLPADTLAFEHVPAIGRVTVSSPWIMKALSDFNAGKAYKDQIKPFGFLLTAQIERFGHPPGVDPDHFHLIAPYETDPKKWSKSSWIDQYTGKNYRIATDGHTGTRNTARVKTYADVLEDYEYHPESKCADANGEPCGKQTIGQLHRRHIEVDHITYIGKESNQYEDVESGMIQDEDDVYTEYVDPRRDEWEIKIRPALKTIPLAWLLQNTPFPRRSMIDWRAGQSRPNQEKQESLKKLIAKYRSPTEEILCGIEDLIAAFQQ
jgi:hypothetical protein